MTLFKIRFAFDRRITIMYRPQIFEMTSPQGGEERTVHTMLGRLGQLFRHFDRPISTPRGANQFRVFDNTNGRFEVFDKVLNNWVALDDEMLEHIPHTYTFAPKPVNKHMELDYFVRGVGLLKHSFIWSTKSIPKDHFALLKSIKNRDFNGRYTVTPWLPQIENLGRLEHGFYVIHTDDWLLTYG